MRVSVETLAVCAAMFHIDGVLQELFSRSAAGPQERRILFGCLQLI